MDTKIFETEDLELTATLLSIGHKLHSVRMQDDSLHLGSFALKWSEELNADVISYVDASLRVSPVGFSQCIKRLKKDVMIAASLKRPQYKDNI